MVKYRVKLMRPPKFITLELLEGLRPFEKGTWWRLEEESNSALQFDDGVWENWVAGTPGSVRNIRLYDPSDTKSALLKDYLAGETGGPGAIIVPDFGGEFGAEDFQWIQIACVPASRSTEAAETAFYA